MKNIIAVIPARYNSSRLPGKPLLNFGEYTMIQRVYLQTIKSKYINKAYVTTDDERVKKSVELIGGNVIMIDDECLNGTERIYLALQKLYREEDIRDINIIVNVQGDEPYINPDHIDIAIESYLSKKGKVNYQKLVCSTLHYQIEDVNEINNPSIGKLVLNHQNDIMYCSRNVIPSNKKLEINKNQPYYGHIGVFIFDRNYLTEYMKQNTTYQLEEDIEWLKIIENGYSINSSLVANVEIGVNTQEDYNYLEKKYKLRINY